MTHYFVILGVFMVFFRICEWMVDRWGPM